MIGLAAIKHMMDLNAKMFVEKTARSSSQSPVTTTQKREDILTEYIFLGTRIINEIFEKSAISLKIVCL